jgi:hypothetical protein
MNALVIGSDKEPLLQFVPDKFLVIDDGPFIDQLDLPPTNKTVTFDAARHSFNPLKDMDYRRAREFIDVLNAVFPEGDSTLTKRNSNFILLNALLSEPKRLDTLVRPTKDNTDAYQKIQTLLLSPVLKNVLNSPTNMSFKGTILARLNRAELGDFDCFVLANLLISQYQGPVVIPDFGFYASPFHMNLIRQERLMAGINSFDEVPAFKSQLLQVKEKIGSQCTPSDAELLALYAGIPADSNRHADFIQAAIRTH